MKELTRGFGKVEGSGVVKAEKATEQMIVEMECMLQELELKLGSTKKFVVTRKEMVRNILKDGEQHSIGEISQRVSYLAGKMITSKNISSQLTYIRDDLAKEGNEYSICRIGRGHGKIMMVKNS